MTEKESAKSDLPLESVLRIEPAHLEEIPAAIADEIANLSSASAALGGALHPRTAANLADLVRIMNTYYSNLIEGHDTRPRDIERALAGKFDKDQGRRNLQVEAAAHVRVQRKVDQMILAGTTPEPASMEFVRWLHREFYKDAPDEMLRIKGREREFLMAPGEWRRLPEHDVAVGRHEPPSSERVADYMAYFEKRYRFEQMGSSSRIMAIAAAHHRFNYIHPFPDGNGRVSRLMSHAMAHRAGVGAHGLWSISRGLARGLESRGDYKRFMDHADMPRQGDLDGRGNLSLRALTDFIRWFLKVCVDQVTFMSGLIEIDGLMLRLKKYAEQKDFKPEATRLLEEALIRGSFERGDVPRITGLPERSARRVLGEVVKAGLLASETEKGAVSLCFPADALETVFPRLFPAT
ncbi:Fic family protein [Parvibaculum sp.]|uniref:Fic family protein n=1 Tax=Parvibaculum sp. TaxID=2024848 RepID=UPI001D7D2BC6|nr:Fic family protein [Parvibaculum sp.]MBX3490306.1 Fic family protein [Parvibaculum sp.]